MLSEDDPRHGTMNGYVSGRCRCPLCIDAAKVYRKIWRTKHLEAVRQTERAYYAQNASACARSSYNSRVKRLEQIKSNPEDHRHGTLTAYNLGCRCDACRQAGKKHRDEWKSKTLARLKTDPTDPMHGKTSGYIAGCRCFKCRIGYSKGRKKR